MIELFRNFHWIRPTTLLLLPVGIAVWWYWFRSQDPLRGWRAQIHPDLLKALVVGNQPAGNTRGTAVLAGWIVATIAIAGPTWRLEESPFAQDDAPLVILLKADISMENASDSSPPIERAKMKIADLAEERKGQPLGLIAYAGSAHCVLPPTRDTVAVAQMASEIESGVMPAPGDRLDLALEEASRLLAKSENIGSLVVLANSVSADLDRLAEWRKQNSVAVQILAIQSWNTQFDESLKAAGKILNAPLVQLDAEDRDIKTIVRRASRGTRFQQGNQGNQWHEAGWWLVPLVGLVVLSMFRRTTVGEAE